MWISLGLVGVWKWPGEKNEAAGNLQDKAAGNLPEQQVAAEEPSARRLECDDQSWRDELMADIETMDLDNIQRTSYNLWQELLQVKMKYGQLLNKARMVHEAEEQIHHGREPGESLAWEFVATGEQEVVGEPESDSDSDNGSDSGNDNSNVESCLRAAWQSTYEQRGVDPCEK